MTAKRETVDRWDGILDPIPFVANEPGEDLVKQYDVFGMMKGYEQEASKVLEAGGYPLTIKELLKQQRKERRVRDIMRMLTCFREVRIYIWMNDPAGAALSMAYGVRAALQARIRPEEPYLKVGRNRSAKQKQTRSKRKTWNDLTREQISARDQKIIAHYKQAHEKNSAITANSFAKQHASEYLLSPSWTRQIISKHLDS